MDTTNVSPENLPGHCAKPLLGDVFRSCLTLFLGGDEDYKPEFKTPFINEQYVLATDGSIIISFDKSLLSEIYFESHPKAPNALKIIPENNTDIVFSVELLSDAVKQIKQAVSKKYLKKLCECPDCFGSGFVNYEFRDFERNTHELEGDCPTCEQTGQFERITNIETGEKDIEGFEELLKWNDTLFRSDYIQKIVKVAEMFDLSEVRLVSRKSEHSLHKFIVGECTICLMPVYKSNDCDVVQNIA